MDFVINEWFAEYLKPDATVKERQKFYQFYKWFLEKNNSNRIIINTEQPLYIKLQRYAKSYQIYPSGKLFKSIISTLLINNTKTLLVDEDFELPDKLNELLQNGNFSSDAYLFKCALQSKSKIIVTTDSRLQKHTEAYEDVKVILLDDFLNDYCSL